MLHRVDVGSKRLDRYGEIVGAESLVELRTLATPLRGRRVAHINSTAYGGGVSELLRSLVPLYRALEVESDLEGPVRGRRGLPSNSRRGNRRSARTPWAVGAG